MILVIEGAITVPITPQAGLIQLMPGSNFARGDVNQDGLKDIGDPSQLLNVLFQGAGPLTCRDAADCNDDGTIDLADVVFQLDYLFASGSPLPAPEACGADPTIDALDCEFPACPSP